MHICIGRITDAREYDQDHSSAIQAMRRAPRVLCPEGYDQKAAGRIRAGLTLWITYSFQRTKSIFGSNAQAQNLPRHHNRVGISIEWRHLG